jgi:hypothetical protein
MFGYQLSMKSCRIMIPSSSHLRIAWIGATAREANKLSSEIRTTTNRNQKNEKWLGECSTWTHIS